MRIEYDRAICNGWFQCVQEWDEFEMDIQEGKANLDGAENTSGNIFVRDVPEENEDYALAAVESCPVNAIKIYDDGEQIAPDS